MKAKVIATHSKSLYTDGIERIDLKFAGADGIRDLIRIPNTMNLVLDDVVEVEMSLEVPHV